MIPRGTYIKNLLVAEGLVSVEGCVIECGVWRGGMSPGLVAVLGTDREYHLFDSFEGLPPAQPIDGEAAIKWQSDPRGSTYFDNCRAGADWADRAMKLSGATRYYLHKGWFQDTVAQFSSATPIALLRMDGDWYDSTITCLRSLAPRVSLGGTIIIDDYYTWDGCAKATHDWLSENKSEWRIVQRFGEICELRRSGLVRNVFM